MTFERIRHRLESGRPLVLDADNAACLRARGHALDVPGALGQLLRERPEEVLSHYLAEVESRVDILTALTADTTPRSLAEVGMQHRAAALTGRALELAFEAVATRSRPVAVAGVLGSDAVMPVASDRVHEELAEHAARLHAASAEVIIARGQGSRFGLLAAVRAAASTGVFTWAVLEHDPEQPVGLPLGLARELRGAGAALVLFEVPSVEVGLFELRASLHSLSEAGLEAGVLLAASADAVRGFEDESSEPAAWVERAIDLTNAGARVIGGGAGTTEAHTRTLATALGLLHPTAPPAAPQC
jgi:5-methyltetrahydrofolate--homocysteine methyltransferase